MERSADIAVLSGMVGKLAAGRWGVAVSGGADSVALLRLAAGCRSDLGLHVVHLNHETRGADSVADAAFARTLADTLRLPSTITTRSALESSLTDTDRAALSSNLSARYRSLRLTLYRRVAGAHNLAGVLLAHHADDQAETILMRLIRGAGYAALAGMGERAEVAGVTLVRPLLGVRRSTLRAYLTRLGQPWREDASNAGDDYARNRVRRTLADRPTLAEDLLAAGRTCGAARDWVTTHTPRLPDRFTAADLATLPDVLATAAAAGWLRRRGVGPDDVSPTHVAAVIAMCRDVAGPAKHAAPGGVVVRRRGGRVFVEVSGRK